MAKTQLNMRADSMVLDVFKSQAESRGLTQVEYFEKMINDSSHGKTIEILSKRLDEMNLKVEEKELIIESLERKYGVKIKNVTRKVTFIVSEEHFKKITALSHKLQIPKNQLMTQFFLINSYNHTPLILQNEGD